MSKLNDYLRELDESSDRLLSKVKPKPYGHIPVGSGDIDRELKADSIRVFIKSVYDGLEANQAALKAIDNSQQWIDNWNNKREPYVHIHSDRYILFFQDCAKRVIKLLK